MAKLPVIFNEKGKEFSAAHYIDADKDFLMFEFLTDMGYDVLNLADLKYLITLMESRE